MLAQLDKAQEQEIRNEGEEAKSTTHAGRGSDKEEQRQLDRQVTLNVGGRTFKTFQLHLPQPASQCCIALRVNPDVSPSPPPRSTLQQYPDTLLGAMFSERNQALVRHSTEYFFDRNGDLFASILDFYRHGYAPASSILARCACHQRSCTTRALVAPQTIDKDLWQRELDYWHLPHMAEEPQKVPEMLHKVVSALNQGYHKTVKTHQTLITRACQELSTKLDAELGTGMYSPFHFNRRDASCLNQRNIQASWHLLLMARSGSFLFTSAHSLQRPIGIKQRQLADPLWVLVCHSPFLKPSLTCLTTLHPSVHVTPTTFQNSCLSWRP